MNSFKELEMIGFKSFADKININFDGGITAIVGPNGCGKSNVADAIRWVLGEQSSKNLRGKSMQDVIFAGSEKRKKLSYCEVTLVFDNTQKWFNVEYDEVSITRKLYRSGDSEYYLNKQSCRLKDIVTLLYDCGIGRDGYSIIGQGKVEEIISSKPEDRRSIFEDAAGISKFKAQKIESERRLTRTQDNMTRLRDIIMEIEHQVGPLKKQSENAKLYLEYKEQLKSYEINALLFNYENASIEKKKITDKIDGVQEELKIKQNELDNYQIKYDSTMNEINKTDRDISNIRDEILKMTVRLSEKQGEQNVMSERLTGLNNQLINSKSNLDRLLTENKQRTQLLDINIKKREEETENLNLFKNEYEKTSNVYLEIIDNLTAAEGEAEHKQRNILANLSKLADIKASKSGNNAKIEILEENINNEQKKLLELTNKESEIKSNIKINRDEILIKEDFIEKYVSDYENTELEIENISKQIEEYHNQINAQNNAINTFESKINILKSLKEDYEGYAFSVRRLLNDSKNNNSLNNAIMGVVGNIINVPSQYQTAIEMALGGSIQNIVTANEEDAKVLVQYLKEVKGGRATFLPLTSIKGRSLINEKHLLERYEGFIGVASEIVTFDNRFFNAISSILGATVIVDTLDNAVKIAKSMNYSIRIVTLEGEVLSPQGSMTGGSKKSNDTSILSKDSEINSLNEKIVQYKKSVSIYQNKLQNAIEKLENLKGKLQSINDTINNERILINSLNLKQSNYIQLQSEIETNIYDTEGFIKHIISSIDELNNRNADDTSDSNINSFDEATESLSNKNSMYEELKEKREKYNQQSTEIKIKIASSEEKIINISADIERLENEILNSEVIIKASKNEVEKNQQLYNTAMNMHMNANSDIEYDSLKQTLEKSKLKLSTIDDYKNNLNSELKSFDEKKVSTMEESNKLQNRVFQEEAKLQKFDIELENMQEKIYEEYSLIYSECLPFRIENYEQKEGNIIIHGLKTKINALGTINVSAIEDYKAVSSRYEELSEQMQDLESAESDLVKIIKDLSQEMTVIFNENFQKINENFKVVFKELFGGGNARLELLESEDPLNAGVDIVAEPPGKKLANITLLSGGEKSLTAIAILFAILKLKAMPFCLLDEIEAALDDANVERFAKYLHRFSSVTQFIVITHRKPTMELAHSMYGVTMEEKGVSKTVSVMLSDVLDTNK